MTNLQALLLECAGVSDPLMSQMLHVVLEQKARLTENQLYHDLLVELIGQLVESEQQLAQHKESLLLAKEALEAQNRQLIELDRIKQDVELIARHDLKSPLNGIIGCADLLLATTLSAEQQRHLQSIRKAGMSALHMINLSLGLYRMEQGNYPLQAVPVDLVPVLEAIREDARALTNSNDLYLDILLESVLLKAGDAFLVRGEELLCYSMFANLIKNALEAAPMASTVRVLLFATAKYGVILIHNYGEVPKRVRPRFFEKYTTSGKRTGTGLGTYSARLICETMGGQIAMCSSQAEGTRIIVALPAGGEDCPCQTLEPEVLEPWKHLSIAEVSGVAREPGPESGKEAFRVESLALLAQLRRAIVAQDLDGALEKSAALKRLATVAGVAGVSAPALRLRGVIEVESWEEAEQAFLKLERRVQMEIALR